MTTMTTASARGRANRRKGNTAERAVAGWLRENGWPGAERAVRTGFRTATRAGVDPGDLTGTPGIVWQIKDVGNLDQPAALDKALQDTATQRREAGVKLGLLVQRRRGVADPGRWWVWLPAAALTEALADFWMPELRVPIRMELRHLAPLLRRAGYGTALPGDLT